MSGEAHGTALYHRDVPASLSPSAATFDAVLFDFGGVLIDSPFDAFARYEQASGLPDGFIRRVNASNHHDNAWARMERNEIAFDEFVDLFGEETAAAGARVDVREVFALLTGELRPAMVEALRRLRPHFRTGLLTNNFAVPLVGGGHEEVLAMFDVIVASADVGVRKPDPRFYQLACEQLGVEPERCVFLDDLGINLKPARQLGMTTIKVGGAERAVDELQQVLGIPLR